MKKLFLIVIFSLVAGVGYYLFFSRNQENIVVESVSLTPSTSPVATFSANPSVSPTSSATIQNTQTKEFTVAATPFIFSLSEIKVKKGDKVKIIFRNDKGIHDWVIDEFNVRTKVLQAGQSETIEFIADKTGTFEYYCSVNGHRQMGMKGNLIVE